MDSYARPATCFECREPVVDIAHCTCVFCFNVFCRRHLTIRQGIPNCAACEPQRRAREAAAISEAEAANVIALVIQDVARTVGSGYESMVRASAAGIRLFAADALDFEQQIVDDVQQYLHDTFVATSWPLFPDHPNHPLWYVGRAWTCTKSGKRVAPLGELPAS